MLHHLKYTLLLVLMSGPLFASGTDIEIENELSTGDVSTVISGGRAYGLSGGDMDIAQCLATHSVLFGLWQGTHLNAICVADVLDINGRHKEAAEMRCSVKRFRKVYGTVYECVKATTFIPAPIPAPLDDPRAAKYLESEEVLHSEQQVEMESIESRLARIEAGNRAAARKAQQRRDYAKQTIERLENDPEK